MSKKKAAIGAKLFNKSTLPIGLFLIKNQMEAMGGSMAVKSEPLRIKGVRLR